MPYLLLLLHVRGHRHHVQRGPAHRGQLRPVREAQASNGNIVISSQNSLDQNIYLKKLYSVNFQLNLIILNYQVTNCQHDEFSHTHFSYYANLMVIYDNATLENQPFIMEEINHFESKKVCGREEGLTHQK